MANIFNSYQLKQITSLVIILILLWFPMTGFSIVFFQKDEKGNFRFGCEGHVGKPMRIKLIEKNTYKVLGPYIGKVIRAATASEAAQIACGEGMVSRKKRD